MSDRTKYTTIISSSIIFALGIIFWSGFTYSTVTDNTEEIKENRVEVKEVQKDIMYIRENMITKRDLRDLISTVKANE